MDDYPHLEAGTRSAVELSSGERISRLRRPHWIAYPRAKRIFEKLEDLLSFPTTHRMPNLLIVGETNNGKTVIVSRFQRLHPAGDNASGDHANVPVLLIQAPPAPDEGQFIAPFWRLWQPHTDDALPQERSSWKFCTSSVRSALACSSSTRFITFWPVISASSTCS